MQQTVMDALLLFIAFPSLLQGTPKILVRGHAEEECLPRAVTGREKVFCSHASGLQPISGRGLAQSLSCAVPGTRLILPSGFSDCCLSSPTPTYGSRQAGVS